ncbi:MAG TPA: hypothetical protein VKZ53_28625 [Candidatus Angelobacter sp.]|nr:hypothetical protein [Candidatus Angelobacter sp.]
MKSYFCSRQREIASALQAGPLSGPLAAHIEICPACSDLVLVAQTLRQARQESMQTAHHLGTSIGSPSVLWWKAQVRRRNAALEKATRPTVVMEKIALATILAVVICLILLWKETILGWLIGISSAGSASWDSFGERAWFPLLLAAGLGTIVLFGGLVVRAFRVKE